MTRKTNDIVTIVHDIHLLWILLDRQTFWKLLELGPVPAKSPKTESWA